MPTYTYACTACGHRFDAFQSIMDDSLKVCPECAGALRKVINPVGVAFKGSGFYRTDSRSEKKQSGSRPTESTLSESKSAESKSAESKPAESKQAESKPSESKPAKDSNPAGASASKPAANS